MFLNALTDQLQKCERGWRCRGITNIWESRDEKLIFLFCFDSWRSLFLTQLLSASVTKAIFSVM